MGGTSLSVESMGECNQALDQGKKFKMPIKCLSQYCVFNVGRRVSALYSETEWRPATIKAVLKSRYMTLYTLNFDGDLLDTRRTFKDVTALSLPRAEAKPSSPSASEYRR